MLIASLHSGRFQLGLLRRSEVLVSSCFSPLRRRNWAGDAADYAWIEYPLYYRDGIAIETTSRKITGKNPFSANPKFFLLLRW
jgi:hypothetical protein